MAVSTFEIEFVWEKKITPDISHLAFRVRGQSGPFIFEPGQFITLLLGEGSELKRRSYSIATIPGEGDGIEMVVSRVPGGFASEILFNLKPGQILKALGPVGRLLLKAEPKSRYILVGTGTGIGPYRSMLPALLQRVKAGNFSVHILLGVRTRAEAIFKSDFEEFAARDPSFQFYICYSREQPETLSGNERSGYVQTQLESLNLNPSEDAVYLCGNPHMIDQSFELLKSLSFDISDIRREKYISS